MVGSWKNIAASSRRVSATSSMRVVVTCEDRSDQTRPDQAASALHRRTALPRAQVCLHLPACSGWATVDGGGGADSWMGPDVPAIGPSGHFEAYRTRYFVISSGGVKRWA